MILWWILALLSIEAHAETKWEPSIEVGSQAATQIQRLGAPESFTRIRPYVDAGTTATVELGADGPTPSEFALRLRARGWLDTFGGSSKTPAEFFPVEGTFGYQRAWFTGELGLQQISWGETFGVFIADIVNPLLSIIPEVL